jgi:hypothetical protein
MVEASEWRYLYLGEVSDKPGFHNAAVVSYQ